MAALWDDVQHTDEGGSKLLRNVGEYLPDYIAQIAEDSHHTRNHKNLD
jgi:hypothetical protein